MGGHGRSKPGPGRPEPETGRPYPGPEASARPRKAPARPWGPNQGPWRSEPDPGGQSQALGGLSQALEGLGQARGGLSQAQADQSLALGKPIQAQAEFAVSGQIPLRFVSFRFMQKHKKSFRFVSPYIDLVLVHFVLINNVFCYTSTEILGSACSHFPVIYLFLFRKKEQQ